MSKQRYADSIAAKLREVAPGGKLLDEDVPLINQLAENFFNRTGAPFDEEKFFGAVRNSFGSLNQSQVDGFKRLLGVMKSDGWPLSWTAYGLATAWHETNERMQPVEEGYYLGEKAGDRHRRSLRYYPWYGRGDVQLTWEENYRKADKALDLRGQLVNDPDLALRPEISARIMTWGMRTGAFTGRKLGDYLRDGPGSEADFIRCRYIVNVQDKARKIAGEALKFQTALALGGWK